MKVELVNIGKEDFTFSIDGRKVEVPCETKIYDRSRPDDIRLCFFPAQSIDSHTKKTVDAPTLNIIVDYIKAEFLKNDKYEMDMAE